MAASIGTLRDRASASPRRSNWLRPDCIRHAFECGLRARELVRAPRRRPRVARRRSATWPIALGEARHVGILATEFPDALAHRNLAIGHWKVPGDVVGEVRSVACP